MEKKTPKYVGTSVWGKILFLTLYFVPLYCLLVAVGNYWGMPTGELFWACLVCWFFEILSVVSVGGIRRASVHAVAGVWWSTLPRFGGPLLTIMAVSIFAESDLAGRFAASIVCVYLASLPVAVFLTLPPRDLDATPEKCDSSGKKR